MAISIQTPSEHIPWYRTRLFWGGMFSVLALWVITFFVLDVAYATKSLNNFIDTILLTTGGALLTLYGSKFFGATGGLVFGLVYIFIFVLLIVRTFSESRVRLVYPLTLTILVLSGNILGLMYLGGL